MRRFAMWAMWAVWILAGLLWVQADRASALPIILDPDPLPVLIGPGNVAFEATLRPAETTDRTLVFDFHASNAGPATRQILMTWSGGQILEASCTLNCTVLALDSVLIQVATPVAPWSLAVTFSKSLRLAGPAPAGSTVSGFFFDLTAGAIAEPTLRVVPEPGTGLLVGMGMLPMVLGRRSSRFA